jgi:YD repeat-containing protein
VGNLLKTIDRNGNATTYVYDAINRRISVTDALGNITQSQYDPVGNLIKLSDANGHATQYTYDPVNRPSTETYADGLSRSYTYDPVGNLITRTDQIGQITNYAYSDLYFLIGRSYPTSPVRARSLTKTRNFIRTLTKSVSLEHLAFGGYAGQQRRLQALRTVYRQPTYNGTGQWCPSAESLLSQRP